MSLETGFSSLLTGSSSIQPFLPFFFVLAIVYGVLSVTNIFKKTSVNMIIALVFAFFASGYPPFLNFFFNNFGYLLWSFIVIFFIAFFMEAIGLRGKDSSKKGKDIGILIIGIAILLLITFVGRVSEMNIPILGSENFLILIGLFLLVMIFYYAYLHGRESEGETRRR